MTKEVKNTEWTVCGRKLLKDNETFFIRGINYAPTPIGYPGRMDMLGHREIYERDLANLRAMHANAVKTYDFYSDVDHEGYLDAAYNDGVDPIYTVFSIWIDMDYMMSHHPVDGPDFQRFVHNYYEMAKLTGHHPGVLGYSIGGEMNSMLLIHTDAFWHKMNLLSAAIRKGLEEINSPHKIITTTFVDDGGLTFTAGEKYGVDVDLWGNNVYQTDYPGSVIPQYKTVPTVKPLLVSEYGFPYANNKREGDDEELTVVGEELVKQTIAMDQNYNLTDGLDEQVLVGGFIFEYRDEWWKQGDRDQHNLGTVKNSAFPMGYLAEEYFGLYGAERPEDGGKMDQLYARPTVSMLKEVWSHHPIRGENEDYGHCREALIEHHITPTDIDLSAKAPSAPAAIESSSPMMAGGMFGAIAACAMIVLALVAVRTRARRAKYTPLGSPNAQSRMTFFSEQPRYDGRQFDNETV